MLLKKFPWLSLGLLFIAHCTFGWFLLDSSDPRTAKLIWIFVVIFDLVIAGSLTATPNTIRGRVIRWAGSKDGRVYAVTGFAFLAAIFLFLVRIFTYILALSIATALARLDLLANGFKELPAFMILMLISLSGLVTGLLLRSDYCRILELCPI